MWKKESRPFFRFRQKPSVAELKTDHQHPLANHPNWRFSDDAWHFTPTAERSRAPLLNLGCGGHFHHDWVNVDISAADPSVIKHNILDTLPFADDTFSAVYHSHVLEHLPKTRALGFLRECHRVVVPGGIVRVAVPDLEQICRLYVDLVDPAVRGDIDAAARYDWVVLEMLDQMARHRSGGEMLEYWRQRPMPVADFVFSRVGQEARAAIASMQGEPARVSAPIAPTAGEVGTFRLSGEIHQWMYDRFSLGRLLKDAGFHDPARTTASDSRIPDFASFCLDTMPDGTTRKPDSFFMEATRPLR